MILRDSLASIFFLNKAPRALVAVAVLAAGFAGCRETVVVSDVATGASLTPSSLDFGSVPVGEAMEKEVRVVNGGRAALTVTEILDLERNPSFEISGNGSTLAPGAEQALKIRFHPRLEGELNGRVQIGVDASSNPPPPLALRGIGSPARVRLTPNALDFKAIETFATREMNIDIDSPADIPLLVTMEGEDAAAFRADGETITPRTTRLLHVTYAPTTEGEHRATLVIRACPTCTETIATLRGEAVGAALVVSPSPVNFPPTSVGSGGVMGIVNLTNTNWAPLKIMQVTSNSPSFSVMDNVDQQTIAPGATMSIRVRYQPTDASQTSGALTVRYVSDVLRTVQVALNAGSGPSEGG